MCKVQQCFSCSNMVEGYDFKMIMMAIYIIFIKKL